MPHHHVQGMKEWWNTWRNVIWLCFFLSTKNTYKQNAERDKANMQKRELYNDYMFGERNTPLLCQGVRCILKNKTTKTLESSEGKEKKKSIMSNINRRRTLIFNSQVPLLGKEILNNSLAYPKSLRAVWRVNEVTSPRVGGAPSRHHELGVKNTLATVNISTRQKSMDDSTCQSLCLPHTLCRRSVTPCWSCRPAWPCWDGRACGLPSGEVRRTARRRRSPSGWRSSVRGPASAGSLWLGHLGGGREEKHTLSQQVRIGDTHRPLGGKCSLELNNLSKTKACCSASYSFII